MGGGGKGGKQTVGYKYLLGLHLIYALGQVDKLIRLKFDDRVAWTGAAAGGRIFVHKPDLFGGDKRQGGVSGYIDVETGADDQVQNDYLVRQLGTGVPAFRGTTALVMRQFYLSNNPYLKKPAAKWQRVYKTPDGDANWYPEKAGIGSGFYIEDSAVYIALDGSGSMVGSKIAAAKDAIIVFLEGMRDISAARNDIRIVLWGATEAAAMERRNCTTADYNALIAFVSGLGATAGGTDFQTGVASAKVFFDGDQTSSPYDLAQGSAGFPTQGQFSWTASGDIGSGLKRRVVLFMTDGEPEAGTAEAAAATLAQISSVEVYGFNIELTNTYYTALLDNTPDDGVPVIAGSDSDALLVALRGAFSTGLDYNPAHFLRDVILFPASGTTDQATNIGDSFTAAADLFYSEGFGISLKFQSPSSKRENKKEIERHVDARVYKDRATQKWEIKPIRPDYVIGDLFVVDASNATGWSNFSTRMERQLPNQVTIKYTHPDKNETVALTLTNPARVQLAGRVINEVVEYPGIRDHALAARVCARDLAALGAPLKTGTVTVFDLPDEINIGWPIVLDNPRQEINGAVFRIVDLKEGDGLNNAIELEVAEEVFALGTDALVAESAEIAEPLSGFATPVTERFVEEAPYYEIVRQISQDEADRKLATDDALGFLNLGGGAPTRDALGAVIHVDAGAGYSGAEFMDFAFTLSTRSSLSASGGAVQILTDIDADLQLVTIGSLAWIGGEHVRIDSVAVIDDTFALDDVFSAADVFSDAALITVGRACLDTVLAAHPAGSALVFWSEGPESDYAEYFAGEVANVKLATLTAIDTLDDADAPTDVVTFDRRAVRPYPPGNLKVDATFAPYCALGPVSVTWAHRDRTTQTTGIFEDHSYSDIGPEPGVTYKVAVDLIDAAGAVLLPWIDQAVGAATSFGFDPYGYSTADVFALADMFALADVFFDSDTFASADMFDLADVFGRGQPLSARSARVSVRSIRDGLESRSAASITVELFLPPTNLSIMEI